MKALTQFLVMVVLCLAAGCTYTQPLKPGSIYNSMVVPMAYDAAWEKTITALTARSALIKMTDKDNGLITTEKQAMRLTEDEAECGSVLGLRYIKDPRVTVYVAYAVHLRKEGEQTGITVNTNMEGLFNPSAIGENKTLTCYSMGALEKALLKAIHAQ